MNWKNWLTTLGSAALGGAGAYLSAALSSGSLPTTVHAAEVLAGGAALAALIAVVHLYQPAPPVKS